MSGGDVDDVLWDKICFAFPIIMGKTPDSNNPCSDENFHSICLEIRRHTLHEDLEDLILKNVQDELLNNVVPTFWSYFDKTKCTTNFEGFRKFTDGIFYLAKQLRLFMVHVRPIEKLRNIAGYKRNLYGYEDIEISFHVILKAALLSKLPKDHDTVTTYFYKHSFSSFVNQNANSSLNSSQGSTGSSTTCKGCTLDLEMCKCESIVDLFYKVNKVLLSLGILEQLTGNVITNLIHKHIEKYVEEMCTGSFDRSYIETLEQWLENVVIVWLSRIYAPDQFINLNSISPKGKSQKSSDTNNESKSDQKMDETSKDEDMDTTNSSEKELCHTSPVQSKTKLPSDTVEGRAKLRTNHEVIFEENKQRLMYLLYETYTRLRIDQLFNIIIEYPESGPAVDDLRKCLQKVNLRSTLTGKLQMSLETRLLHPGVNTCDILTAYISAIRALKQLDPSGVLLETVTKPIRQYLRNRDDTIRCVVHSLTEEGPTDLAEELVSGSATVQTSEDADDIADWEHWLPDPVDADPSSNSKSRRTSDIITMLVNVYGSKELFVNEYRTLLADRLLSNFTYRTEKEIRYLELLKLRFGDSLLHCCEVMLKDIYDSKRINAHLHTDTSFVFDNQQFPVTAMIVSAQFWPTFKDETLELPELIKEHFAVYTKAFEAFKGNRTLNWKPHLGLVKLEIELKSGRILNLSVSPTHAAIISHFENKPEWTIDELSVALSVSATVLRRKITFWQSQGLIREVASDKFCLIEEESNESPSKNKNNTVPELVCEDEEAESAMASAHELREEELQVFWTYIVGMLTNLDGLPLERIHQMLKMFASQGPPSSMECSLQELRKFLDRKVHEHKLLFSGSYYRLPKS
uniref:Anaphase-promoting complex subunit 2 n=1 Tax=Cacopsylla melanoneura TaxID=428564 RepID=A0A8D8R059_9HEMI